jgi:N-methylhydantoinase B/oxoprolinase/acetone carboxylase alpha subunit
MSRASDILYERRVTTPYGLKGGEDGASGQNLIKKIDPVTGDSRIVSLGPRGLVKLGKGDQFIIKSPGGGGWGKVVEVNGNGNGKIEAPNSEKVLTNGTRKSYPRATGSVHTYSSTQNSN